jgi:hypothetical protein
MRRGGDRNEQKKTPEGNVTGIECDVGGVIRAGVAEFDGASMVVLRMAVPSLCELVRGVVWGNREKGWIQV